MQRKGLLEQQESVESVGSLDESLKSVYSYYAHREASGNETDAHVLADEAESDYYGSYDCGSELSGEAGPGTGSYSSGSKSISNTGEDRGAALLCYLCCFDRNVSLERKRQLEEARAKWTVWTRFRSRYILSIIILGTIIYLQVRVVLLVCLLVCRSTFIPLVVCCAASLRYAPCKEWTAEKRMARFACGCASV